MIEQLRALYSMTMFHRLKFTLPPHINASDLPHSARMMSLGYRHMCRFHSGLMYTHAALADYDWCVQRPPGMRCARATTCAPSAFENLGICAWTRTRSFSSRCSTIRSALCKSAA